MTRRQVVLAALLAMVMLVSCGVGFRSNAARDAQPLCAFWYAIGDSPQPDEIDAVAKRYGVIVLNAWDVDRMRQIRAVNPSAKVLVYKDLSSTRNYPGAVDGGADAAFLPTGVGYVAAKAHPEWFAHDAAGNDIEWSKAYPGHWQMAVWDPAYQRAWTDAVTAEVVREGWDGVLADNAINQLGYYTDTLFAGTSSSEETNQKLRDGLTALVGTAGSSVSAAGKLFVPNISEPVLAPGRWPQLSRFGGGMDEYFSFNDAGAPVVTFEGTEYGELQRQAQSGEGLQLLMTHAADDDARRTGFVAAALVAGRNTCWMSASNPDYKVPDWSSVQELPLGEPLGVASHQQNGVWDRNFAGGWVVLNGTSAQVDTQVPPGLRSPEGEPTSHLVLAPGEGRVLLR